MRRDHVCLWDVLLILADYSDNSRGLPGNVRNGPVAGQFAVNNPLALSPNSGRLSSEAAKEAIQGVGFDLLVVCGFAFDPHVSEEARRQGKLTVLPAKMNHIRGEQADGELVWVSPMWITYR